MPSLNIILVELESTCDKRARERDRQCLSRTLGIGTALCIGIPEVQADQNRVCTNKKHMFQKEQP